MRMIAPISPTARANAIVVPGEDARKDVRKDDPAERSSNSPAPSERAASSISVSSSMRTGCTVRTTNGSVTKSSAKKIAQRVKVTSLDVEVADPARAGCGPVERDDHQARNDRRQREGQVDDAFTNAFPRNSSRTSTQAVIVPSTAFETPPRPRPSASVSLSAATASGERDDVPELRPSRRRRTARSSAAIGSATMTERKVATSRGRGPLAALSLGVVVDALPQAGSFAR